MFNVAKLKNTALLACFFSTSILASVHDNLDKIELVNSEAEMYIARYSVLHPEANFSKTKKIAESAIKSTCESLKTDLEVCQNDMQSNNLEELLSELSQVKKTLKLHTKINKDTIDRNLLFAAITNSGDPYTTAANNNDNYHLAYLKPKLSKNNTALTLYNFNENATCSSEIKNIVFSNIKYIDLRDNGGGSIQCTLYVLAKILPIGRHKVATIQTINGEEELWIQGESPATEKNKHIVEVNHSTASTAEIFAKNLEQRGWQLVGGKMKDKRTIQARFRSAYGDYYLTVGTFSI